jgi:nucleotide-binding universal stress UspA family protein
MAEWKRICCAIDFSKPSRFAMAEVCELARKLGADLTLLHVNETPVVSTGEMLLSPPELSDRAAKEIEPKMRSWRGEAEGIMGRPVKSVVAMGNPIAEILRFARESSIDVLVMATHGRTGLARLVLGSVAEQVVREAPCPVLLFRGAAVGTS